MTDTTISTSPQIQAVPDRTNSEVLEKAARRRFTAEYKQRILAEADACKEAGQIGALLRREGLYSSHLAKWREQREKAIRMGWSKPRGRKPAEQSLLAEENARLQQEIQRLQARLSQAHTLIEVPKKLSQLLGLSESTLHSGAC